MLTRSSHFLYQALGNTENTKITLAEAVDEKHDGKQRKMHEEEYIMSSDAGKRIVGIS
jgi:hypothetical protein